MIEGTADDNFGEALDEVLRRANDMIKECRVHFQQYNKKLPQNHPLMTRMAKFQSSLERVERLYAPHSGIGMACNAIVTQLKYCRHCFSREVPMDLADEQYHPKTTAN